MQRLALEVVEVVQSRQTTQPHPLLLLVVEAAVAVLVAEPIIQI